MQNVKTVVLLAAISGILIAVGAAIGGPGGAVVALVVAGAMNVGSYWLSADIVLKTSKAHEIEQGDDPDLFRMIEGVAREAEMPMPRVYVIDSPQPNAFATGRSPKHAAVAVTTGIRRMLSDRELRGVLGHEMAHVANRDILTSSIVATIASAISLLSFFAFWFGDRRNGLALLAAAIVAPIAATVIQLAVSRAREYQADADGARLRGRPGGAGLRARQARARRAADPDAGAGVERAPVHREPAHRAQLRGAILDAPADGAAHLAAAAHGRPARLARVEASLGRTEGPSRGPLDAVEPSRQAGDHSQAIGYARGLGRATRTHTPS